MTKKEKKKVASYLILIIIASAVLSIFGGKINLDWLESYIQSAGVLAPVVFTLILALNQIIAPLSGTPVYLIGYVIFGDAVVFYNYLSYLIAAIVNFLISRTWGRGWVIKLVGSDDMDKVDKFTQDYGLKTLIFLRLFQSHLSDFVSYAYGLTNIKFTIYLLASILVPIPPLVIWYVYILPLINNVTDFSLWFFVSLIPLFIITWFYWKYLSKKNAKTK